MSIEQRAKEFLELDGYECPDERWIRRCVRFHEQEIEPYRKALADLSKKLADSKAVIGRVVDTISTGSEFSAYLLDDIGTLNHQIDKAIAQAVLDKHDTEGEANERL